MGISAYSTTPASNTTISGINIAEGCAPSGINDAIRQMMADIATDVPNKNAATNYTAAQNFAKGADIASASTTAIGAATGNYVNVTGTTTITAFDTVQAGTERWVKFSGILTLTYNATSLILPGSANILTAAGDIALFVSEGAGNWRCALYSPANGVPLGIGSTYAPIASPTFTGTPAAPTPAAGTNTTQVITAAYTFGGVLANVQVFTASGTYTPTTGTSKALIFCQAGGGGGGGSGSSGGGTGGTGGTTSVGALASATGGVGGIQGTSNGSLGGAGGVGSLGLLNLAGSGGGATYADSQSSTFTIGTGGYGGVSFFGGGALQSAFASSGNNAGANTGSGGSGASSAPGTTFSGSGGGAGGLSIAFASNTIAQTVTIGAGGTGGTAGTSGSAGGAGGSGVVLILEFK